MPYLNFFEQNSIESKFALINKEITILKKSYNSNINYLINAYQNEIDMLKKEF